jgi:hypothetical protein
MIAAFSYIMLHPYSKTKVVLSFQNFNSEGRDGAKKAKDGFKKWFWISFLVFILRGYVSMGNELKP